MQARPLPQAARRRIHAGLHGCGFRELTDTDFFFDVSVVSTQQISRYRFDGLSLTDRRTGSPLSTLRFVLHVTWWSIGFATFRATAEAPIPVHSERTLRAVMRWLHAIDHEGTPGQEALEWRVELCGQEITIAGSARRLFDALFWALDGLVERGTVDPATVQRRSASFHESFEAMSRKWEKGQRRLVGGAPLLFRWPSTIGTHMEVHVDSEEISSHENLVRSCFGSSHQEPGDVIRVDEESSSLPGIWLVAPMQSVTIVSRATEWRDPVREREAFNAWQYPRLLEYLALRRCILACVQRESQVAAARGRTLREREFTKWLNVTSVAVDDNVLANWYRGLLERLQQRLEGPEGVTSLKSAERQVLDNLSFAERRLKARADRAGIVLGILFGVVAAAALLPLAEAALGLIFQSPPSAIPNEMPITYLTIGISIMLLLSFLAAIVFNRFLRIPGDKTLGGGDRFPRLFRRPRPRGAKVRW